MAGLNKQGKTVGTGLPGPGRPRGRRRPGSSRRWPPPRRSTGVRPPGPGGSKLQEWLDRVAQDNPKAALDAYIKIAEFVLPRVSRAAPQPLENYPREIVVSWVAVDE